MSTRPEGVGDIEYLDVPECWVPTVEVVYDDPVGVILGPDGDVVCHVWPSRPPVGFVRSDRCNP